jgi:hypothetical protein
MGFGDPRDDRQSEAGMPCGSPIAAPEATEDKLPVTFGNTRPPIEYADESFGMDVDLDGRTDGGMIEMYVRPGRL